MQAFFIPQNLIPQSHPFHSIHLPAFLFCCHSPNTNIPVSRPPFRSSQIACYPLPGKQSLFPHQPLRNPKLYSSPHTDTPTQVGYRDIPPRCKTSDNTEVVPPPQADASHLTGMSFLRFRFEGWKDGCSSQAFLSRLSQREHTPLSLLLTLPAALSKY